MAEIRLFNLNDIFLRRMLLVLWVLIPLLASLYFFLEYTRPGTVAWKYFRYVAQRTDNPERGALRFFIERQRRSIFELSRSVYMYNLITYTQGQSAVTDAQVQKMESFIKGYQEYFGYKQIFLLDRNGLFVFSTLPEVRGKNINDPEYANSPILDSFKLSSMTLVSDISSFRYDPIIKQKALFITIPVFFEAKLNGFLVIHVVDAQISELLSKDVDLGATGEILITQRIGDQIIFVMPPQGDPDLSLLVRPEINNDYGSPSERSALGYQGYGVSQDYRGVKVVAAWYFIPQLNWGFVCKTNYDEIMWPVKLLGYGVLLLLLCAGLFTGLYFFRRKKDASDIQSPSVPPVP